MRQSQERYEVEEDAAPLDMLMAMFEARGWPCEATASEICGEIQGSWTKYQLRGIWRDEDQVLQLLALPDIRVNDDKRAVIYETLGLINEQLWLGHFELWSSSGIILFRHGALLGQGGTLTDQQAWDAAAFIDSQERPRDPRQTGSVADNAAANHGQDTYYGKIVEGRLLGTGTGR